MNTSPRPKSVALMFLLGAFLTGGAVGYAATITFGGPRTVATPPTQAQLRDGWKQRLELTPEQVAKFDSLYDQRRVVRDSIKAIYQPAIDSIVRKYMPVFDSIRTENHAKVQTFLNSHQKDTYQKMIEEDKQKADSMSKARATTGVPK